ncbi:MAG: GIY-YIG nuclease family protein, partial [Sphingobacteriia bacterium]
MAFPVADSGKNSAAKAAKFGLKQPAGVVKNSSNLLTPTSPARASSEGGLFVYSHEGGFERACRASSGRCPTDNVTLCMWFVYVLKCSDGNHYTGCTQNIPARIEKHQSGHVPATKGRLPVELITYIA